MQAVEGIYHNGHIKLFETPKEIRRARVIVTFLEDDDSAKETENNQSLAGTIKILDNKNAGKNQSVVGLGEVLDDDLEAASLEIRQEFLTSIEKSCKEFDK